MAQANEATDDGAQPEDGPVRSKGGQLDPLCVEPEIAASHQDSVRLVPAAAGGATFELTLPIR